MPPLEPGVSTEVAPARGNLRCLAWWEPASAPFSCSEQSGRGVHPAPERRNAQGKPLSFCLFFGQIEEGARVFTPARLLPFDHPEAHRASAGTRSPPPPHRSAGSRAPGGLVCGSDPNSLHRRHPSPHAGGAGAESSDNDGLGPESYRVPGWPRARRRLGTRSWVGSGDLRSVAR